jgi:hypothetical protein
MEPIRQRATKQYPPPYSDDAYYPARQASSSIKYAATQGGQYSQRVNPAIVRPRISGKAIFVVAAFVFIGCYMLWTLWVVPTATNISTQWHYGDAKASVMSADVGRGMEEFIAFTDKGHIVVLEIGKTYQGYTANISVTGSHLVTLAVKDVNMDGKPDLVVTIDGADGSFVLFNTGKGFSWSQ